MLVPTSPDCWCSRTLHRSPSGHKNMVVTFQRWSLAQVWLHLYSKRLLNWMCFLHGLTGNRSSAVIPNSLNSNLNTQSKDLLVNHWDKSKGIANPKYWHSWWHFYHTWFLDKDLLLTKKNISDIVFFVKIVTPNVLKQIISNDAWDCGPSKY